MIAEPFVEQLFDALVFAADKHSEQRRKDAAATPYINHPVQVANVLARNGQASNGTLLLSAILHDTVEDTDTTLDELRKRFGDEVAALVDEVTDDKNLPKDQRKRLQIEHAPTSSQLAKQLKIADKICNVRDLAHSAPAKWPASRVLAYIEWSEAVVAGCRGVNEALELEFERAVRETRAVVNSRHR